MQGLGKCDGGGDMGKTRVANSKSTLLPPKYPPPPSAMHGGGGTGETMGGDDRGTRDCLLPSTLLLPLPPRLVGVNRGIGEHGGLGGIIPNKIRI